MLVQSNATHRTHIGTGIHIDNFQVPTFEGLMFKRGVIAFFLYFFPSLERRRCIKPSVVDLRYLHGFSEKVSA